MSRDKIYCPYLATRNRFALDTSGKVLGLTDTTVLFGKGQPEDLRYVLGLLNPRLLTFRFRYIGKLKSGGVLEYFWNSISKLLIRRLHPSDGRHKRIVELVQRMVDLQAMSEKARSGQEKTRIQGQLTVTDELIDGLVYELYGVTEEEIELVEGALADAPSDVAEGALPLP